MIVGQIQTWKQRMVGVCLHSMSIWRSRFVQIGFGQRRTILEIHGMNLKAAQDGFGQFLCRRSLNDKGKRNREGLCVSLHHTQNTLGNRGGRNDNIHFVSTFSVSARRLKVVLQGNHFSKEGRCGAWSHGGLDNPGAIHHHRQQLETRVAVLLISFQKLGPHVSKFRGELFQRRNPKIGHQVSKWQEKVHQKSIFFVEFPSHHARMPRNVTFGIVRQPDIHPTTGKRCRSRWQFDAVLQVRDAAHSKDLIIGFGPTGHTPIGRILR
mmetsp:Transcript_23780/g.55443  ORF Transcript_23780/g.55443 Transcript_23780/m.55443 type:complete len:266 (-) Transcript_23780:547-1344(-)